MVLALSSVTILKRDHFCTTGGQLGQWALYREWEPNWTLQSQGRWTRSCQICSYFIDGDFPLHFLNIPDPRQPSVWSPPLLSSSRCFQSRANFRYFSPNHVPCCIPTRSKSTMLPWPSATIHLQSYKAVCLCCAENGASCLTGRIIH